MMSLLNGRACSLVAVLVAAYSLAACATYADTAPVPLGDGTYSIGSSGRAGESYQGAIRFCFAQGRQLLQLDGQAGRPGTQSEGAIRFRCVGPGEPGWKEPVG